MPASAAARAAPRALLRSLAACRSFSLPTLDLPPARTPVSGYVPLPPTLACGRGGPFYALCAMRACRCSFAAGWTWRRDHSHQAPPPRQVEKRGEIEAQCRRPRRPWRRCGPSPSARDANGPPAGQRRRRSAPPSRSRPLRSRSRSRRYRPSLPQSTTTTPSPSRIAAANATKSWSNVSSVTSNPSSTR